MSAEYRITRSGQGTERRKAQGEPQKLGVPWNPRFIARTQLPDETYLWRLLDVVLRDDCVLRLQSNVSSSHSDNIYPRFHRPSWSLLYWNLQGYHIYCKWERSKNPVGTQQILFDLFVISLSEAAGSFLTFPTRRISWKCSV
jgi:hypothetical protein